jgi:hypothetical protein
MAVMTEEYEYTLLEQDHRKEMAQQAVFQLEKLLFENEINITVNTPEHELVTTNADGSTHTQTLAGRQEMLQKQLQDVRARFKDLL